MTAIRLKIDVSGTVGDQAFRDLKQFDEIVSASFGPKFGSSGECKHAPDTPHARGNGSALRSNFRRRYWLNTPFRTIWSKTAFSTPT